MDKLVVEGGYPLSGVIQCAGSKNAVLPILAASILTDQPLVVPNAPRLADVKTMLAVLGDLGGEAAQTDDGVATVQFAGEPTNISGWDNVRKMRGSVCVLGPLLARTGKAEVSLPGGCVFGVRPIDLHLKGLEALGAKVTIEHGFVIAKAPKGGLVGGRMFLGCASGSSVLGTANVMMAATLAHGTTIIQGAACEPEVVDLGDCLNSMGARISGLGSPCLTIEGVEKLSGTTHQVIPDRIEAGTYLIAGAMVGGSVRIEGCRPDHLSALLDRFWEANIPYEVGEGFIETLPFDPKERKINPTDVTTHPYPGFPTDLQAQWMAMMTQADGISVISERIYPDRYMHLAELLRLGAQIRREGTTAIVIGGKPLSGAPVTASDLRASAALVLAGLVAKGETEIHRVYHIDRGYERIEERLRSLGAVIRRVPEDS